MLKTNRLLAQLSNVVKTSNLPAAINRTNKPLFSKHLLLTNLSISIGFSGLGDFIEQILEISAAKHLKEWDKSRTFKFATTGLTVGLVCHYWYLYLGTFVY